MKLYFKSLGEVFISYIKKSIIFDKELLSKLGVDNFNLVDIGSSFNLFEPFNIIEKVWEKDLSILCFEPNEDTIIFKSKASRININKALNKEDTVDFHIAINKSESSIYPPDIKLLKIFDEKHWKNRQTAEVVKTKPQLWT